jgi:hypothetical protein
VLNAEPAADEKTESDIKGRLEHGLGLLIEYAKALRSVRASGAFDRQTYPFGM